MIQLQGPALREESSVCIEWISRLLNKKCLVIVPPHTERNFAHLTSSFYGVFLFLTAPTSPAGCLGDPWVCVDNPGENERGVTPPLGPTSVPCISFTECSPHHSSQPDPGDSGEGDYDDGPEYLAIGNLGSRRLSRSSTHSSDHSEPRDQSQQQGSRILPPNRRSSFSEGQKGPGRGVRGHARSFSDTGISTKLRSGKQTPTSQIFGPVQLCVVEVCINACLHRRRRQV